jgi:hypothetical protein
VIAATILLAVAATPSEPAPPPPARKAHIVAGELIVRFRPGTQGARLASTPAAATDAEATLSPVTERLSREIGLPLTARRALSGGEVVLAVGGSSLTNRLLSAARRDRTLEDPSLEAAEPGAAGALPTVRARLRQAGIDTGSLASRLSERLGLPVSVRAGKGREVLLSVDGDALTLQALERLEERPEIESVRLHDAVGDSQGPTPGPVSPPGPLRR